MHENERDMALITFFEKPGCINNARQKKLLKQSGHSLIERDLLAEPWTAGRLRPFFASKQVAEWFNRSSPRIKSGEIIPEGVNADVALALMVEDPLLIRRPLMISGFAYLSGFDNDEVDAWLGIAIMPAAADLETCVQASDAGCNPEGLRA